MLFGKISHGKKFWVIRCEPQVRARLKRLFPRAPQEAADQIRISNTPENCRDLQWFLQRYPMEVKDPEMLNAAADLHRQQEYRVAELLARRAPPLDIKLAEPPRDYQAIVPQFLDVKNGLLLGDDVGLGKTVTAICCLTLPDALPAAVVCPPHLQKHWKQFIGRFAPHIEVRIAKGGPEELTNHQGQPDLLSLPSVIIVSYFRLRRWAETLATFVRTAIFDECQQLRSPETQVYGACIHLAQKANRRLGLSATPIYNYGHEFFHVIDALQPGALGTREEFVREWCKNGAGGEKARLA